MRKTDYHFKNRQELINWCQIYLRKKEKEQITSVDHNNKVKKIYYYDLEHSFVDKVGELESAKKASSLFGMRESCLRNAIHAKRLFSKRFLFSYSDTFSPDKEYLEKLINTTTRYRTLAVRENAIKMLATICS